MRYLIAIIICMVTSAANADDTDVTKGQELHDKHCLACHQPKLYTRPERRVTSREKLSSQVHFCEQQLQLQWFDEEVEGVAEYLNKEYYHFK